MSPLAGRRAGMAILSIEVEEIHPDRVLIRVRTVDDVTEKTEPAVRAFASTETALAYLGDWLERWVTG